MAAIKCADNGAKAASNSEHNIPEIKNEISESSESILEQEPRHTRHATSRLSFQALHRLDERMNKMEHKIAMVSRKRALLEKRVVYEDKEVLSHRVHILESIGRDLTEKVRNVSHELNLKNLTKVLEHVEDEYRSMVDALPGNCEQKDGLTLLAPGPGAPLLAACRKGWIVVGRRIDGTVDFDRSWNDYATGFGSPLNEFWAGNEALHRLSQDNCTRLRIELNDIDGNYWVANYEEFSIDDEDNGYRIRIGGFSGNATDAMSYQNHMRFSAKDRDLDISSTDCAANYHGGWWFSHCQHANLNGRYSLGLTWYRSDVNQWMAVATAELLVQRKEQCL
ncbi:hypothetical protein QAD02_006274 [Eretmocerus hayati]|uniref:Uncharacterized protein n=1 Tax=Eretmocerus hayati TaxID=131215 RepID=A0ACC2N0T2_9HYME|nr:hypothetical protein QAD02_006274 [Eretmocerus hayati]